MKRATLAKTSKHYNQWRQRLGNRDERRSRRRQQRFSRQQNRGSK